MFTTGKQDAIGSKMKREMYKDDILKRMELLDERVDLEFDGDIRFLIIIVGGGALVLRDYIARSTDDIDLLNVDKRLQELMKLYDMNSDANAFLFSFPYNYEDRAKHIWSGEKIDYYTASLEDMVISKICANRDEDFEDFEAVSEMIDWVLLDKLATDEDELRLISMSDRGYQDFKACYENFKRMYRKCKD